MFEGGGEGCQRSAGWAGEGEEGSDADRFLLEEGNDSVAVSVFAGDGGNLGHLVAGSRAEERGVGLGRGDAVVDDPGPGFDAGAPQVGLQTGRFQHGGGFG